jgi:hypothetical protein
MSVKENCLYSEEGDDADAEPRQAAVDALATLLESFNSASANRFCMQ